MYFFFNKFITWHLSALHCWNIFDEFYFHLCCSFFSSVKTVSGFRLSCPLKPATAQRDLETPWTECVDVSVALSCCLRLAERLTSPIWPVCECECCERSTLLWEGGCINWSAGTTRGRRRSNWSIASTSPSLSQGILIDITFTGPDGVCRGKVTVWFKSRSLSWEMCSEIWTLWTAYCSLSMVD